MTVCERSLYLGHPGNNSACLNHLFCTLLRLPAFHSILYIPKIWLLMPPLGTTGGLAALIAIVPITQGEILC